MILHTVNKSPYAADALESCLRVAGRGDTILLIEDGVYAALNKGKFANLPQQSAATFLALAADVSARGLDGALIDSIDTVDYAGFVRLTANHQHVISWY
jgi:tRNA 2-thiouridine synthesizing protein B